MPIAFLLCVYTLFKRHSFTASWLEGLRTNSILPIAFICKTDSFYNVCRPKVATTVIKFLIKFQVSYLSSRASQEWCNFYKILRQKICEILEIILSQAVLLEIRIRFGITPRLFNECICWSVNELYYDKW